MDSNFLRYLPVVILHGKWRIRTGRRVLFFKQLQTNKRIQTSTTYHEYMIYVLTNIDHMYSHKKIHVIMKQIPVPISLSDGFLELRNDFA